MRGKFLIGVGIFVLLFYVGIVVLLVAGLGWVTYLRSHAAVSSPEPVLIGERFAAIEDIKPGMTGYCFSPDEGGIDRLSVIVMGVQKFRGYETKVFLQVKSGRALASGGIAHGMSGSPVYLDDGRLIGALAYGPDDADNTIFVTPIQEMLAQGRHAVAGGYAGPALPVTSFAAFCTVWGSASSCRYATLTYVKDGVAYATGHSFNPVGIQSNSHQTAVFSTPVMMTVNKGSVSRVQGMLGDLLGTSVWDGANGSVIQLGKVPDQFTVHLTVPDAVGYTFHGVRHHDDVSGDMDGAIRNIITEQLDMRRDWDARITVAFADGSAPLIIEDEWTGGLAGLKQFLREVLTQSPQAIGDIQVTLTQSGGKGLYELQKIHVDRVPSGIRVQSILSGTDSHERLVVPQNIPGTFMPKPGLAWYLGRDLHEKTLSLMPATKAVAILNALGDRRRISLACVECEPWTNPNPVEIRARLHLNGLAIDKATTMPFVVGEQKPVSKPEKQTILIPGVRH